MDEMKQNTYEFDNSPSKEFKKELKEIKLFDFVSSLLSGNPEKTKESVDILKKITELIKKEGENELESEIAKTKKKEEFLAQIQAENKFSEIKLKRLEAELKRAKKENFKNEAPYFS